MAGIINFEYLVFKIICGFQKKGSALGQLPFKIGIKRVSQLLFVISGSRSVKFDLDFLRQSFVVFA